jgi:hypothetical protein
MGRNLAIGRTESETERKRAGARRVNRFGLRWGSSTGEILRVAPAYQIGREQDSLQFTANSRPAS